ncbi:hypothetical protein C8A05DRAFT_16546 [Staphylotrichum tortipilum]|uniref:Uncharacterized protein n=1 Tax=Staphylotrichum tortipilum TaxID=2831512 RepID=A0AAN6RSD5_9PEZI|nr:hypothetical protein C8A05DRAFT_16546 [Staphylotrichum longicolle]
MSSQPHGDDEPAPVSATIEGAQRATVEQAQLRRLNQMRDTLDGINSQTLDSASLDMLGVVLGQPLAVDPESPSPWEGGFFRPWVAESFVRELEEAWEFRHNWSGETDPADPYHPAEWALPTNKALWFLSCLDTLCEQDLSLWDRCNTDPTEMFRATGLRLPMHTFTTQGGSTVHQYQSEWTFFPIDGTKPHVACLVFDSCDAPADGLVLSSDVDYAIELIKFRLRHGRHTDHHTKPAIIYTIERESHARITQAYLDSTTNQLVLRQSRQLHIGGPEPTDDAFTFVRWVATVPAGETDAKDEDAAATQPPDMAPRLLLLGCT